VYHQNKIVERRFSLF